MKNSKRAGEPAALLEIIARAVAAGQQREVITLPTGPSPPKRLKRLCRRIEASSHLHLENSIVYHASGLSFQGLVCWIGKVTVDLRGTEHRFCLLAVDRFGQRALYAISVALLGKRFALPGIDLSDGEMQLLLLIADELRDETSEREYRIEARHPARDAVKGHRAQWDVPLDEPALLALLQGRQWLLPVVAAALDAQLRSFKRFQKAPMGVYNFTTASADLQADGVFTLALRSMTFTNAGSYMSAAPPEIEIKEKADIQLWRGCVERVALLRTATGSLLEPILKQIGECERLRACGGQLPPPLPTVPIGRCKAVLAKPFTVDIELPKGGRPLTGAEQDLLRAAVARALTHKTAQAVYARWREHMSVQTTYRMDAFRCWRETIVEAFLWEVLGADYALQIDALLQDTAAAQQAAEQAREQAIRRAIELINQPERYKSQIIERPRSKVEANERLNENADAVAFRYIPQKGADAGQELLAFTRPSLARLLRRVSCGKELIEAVIERAQADTNREIRLGSDTAKFITLQT